MIDSKRKRFSMLDFGLNEQLLPVADGTFDAGDRFVFLGMYYGAGPGASGTKPMVSRYILWKP